MNKTYKILALLLNYPQEEIVNSLESLMEVAVKENLLAKSDLNKIKTLINYLQSTDLLTAQEEYVNLFDRGRLVSLYLFEHIHGESRDRGQAMVDLGNFYKENGLEINSAELPDFLPLFLEFLSTIDKKQAAELLGDVVDIIALIAVRLEQKNSPYSAIFSALQNLSATKAKKIIPEKPTPIEQINEEIDKEWEDPQVTFLGNTNTTSCGGCAKSNNVI